LLCAISKICSQDKDQIPTSKFIHFENHKPIDQAIGLGGVTFKNTIRDFESSWTLKFFDKEFPDSFEYSINDEYFYLTMNSKQKEMRIEIDLFSGKITSMSCSAGYLGKTNTNIGIGTSIKDAMMNDPKLSFNLDTNWFDRGIFDGLIIYPPADQVDNCVDAACSGTKFPNFKIDTIEILELSFAKKHFGDGTLVFADENEC
jgi:hypothetical protein